MGAGQKPYLTVDGPDFVYTPPVDTLPLIEELASYFTLGSALQGFDYILFGKCLTKALHQLFLQATEGVFSL
ncbi:hypothetical protein ES708_17356 [subsurface metagenome]